VKGQRRQRHARIHLPPLTGEQAWALVSVLERSIRAICRAHGDAMADYQGRVFPDLPPPPDAVTLVDRKQGDDRDF
jgi:hypothetical protein